METIISSAKQTVTIGADYPFVIIGERINPSGRGARNISFGLPWRPIVNAAFLSLAIAAGLTSAITNPLESKIRRTIFAADLLRGHDQYAGNLIKAFRTKRKKESAAG